MNSTLTQKTLTTLLAASLVSGGALATASIATAAEPTAQVQISAQVQAADAFQQEILDRTNALRAANGLNPVVWNSDIAAVAQNWTNYQLENNAWSHNPNYAQQIPAGWTAAAENIAANWSAEEVVFSWEMSSSHLANILNPNMTDMGVGYGVQDNNSFQYAGQYYVTQNFAGYAPVVPEPEPTVPPVVPEPEPTVPPVVPEPEPTVPPVVPEPEPTEPPVVPEPEPTEPPVVPEPEPTEPPVTPSPEPTEPPVTEPTDPPVTEPTDPPVTEAPADEVVFSDDNQGGLDYEIVSQWQVKVSNLKPNTAYDFVIHSTPTPIGTLTTDASGSVVVDIPNQLSLGVHTLAAYGAGAIDAGALESDQVLGWVSFEIVQEDPTNVEGPGMVIEAPTVGSVVSVDTNKNGVIDEDELGNTAAGDNTSRNLGLGAFGSMLVAMGLFFARGFNRKSVVTNN